MEERLTLAQAAIKGGHCGPNVHKVLLHLQRPHSDVAGPGFDARRIGQLPGRHAEAIIRLGFLVKRVAEQLGLPAGAHTTFFGDQPKAFERLGYRWLAILLQEWGLPGFIQTALLSLIVEKHVRPATD